MPTGESQSLIKKLLKYENLKFIDLSADFRIKDKKVFKNFYGFEHKAEKLLKESIYSISEFVKKKLKQKNNFLSGCYPTSIQIPLIPLLKKEIN